MEFQQSDGMLAVLKLELVGMGGVIRSYGSGISMKDSRFHPGITMHKIPVGAGLAGLIFTVGSLAVLLLGLPMLWYFLVGALALGVGFATILRLTEH